MRYILIIAFLINGQLLKAQNNQYTRKFFNQFDGLLTQTINSIEKDASGRLLIASDNGLFLFDGKHFSRAPFHSEVHSKRIDDIIVISPGEYLLLGGNTNAVYYIKDNKIVWKETIDGARNVKQLVSYNPASNTLFIKKGASIYKKQGGADDIPQLVYEGKNLISFVSDHLDRLYIWDAFTLTFQDNNQTKVLYQPSSKDLIWRYLVKDNKDIVAWAQDTIMTFREGLLISKTYCETPDHLVVRDAREFDDGSIWFATQNSEILEFDGNKAIGHGKRFNLDNLIVTSAYKDINGTVWLGTIGKGLLMVRPSRVALIENSKEKKINCFAENKNHLLVGTGNGIYLLDGSNLLPLRTGVDFTSQMDDVFFDNYTHQLNYHEGYWLISTMRTRVKYKFLQEVSNLLGEKAIVKNGPSSSIYGSRIYHGFWGSFSTRPISPSGIGEKIKFKPQSNCGRTNRFTNTPEGIIVTCDYGIYLIEPDEKTVDTTLVVGRNILGSENIYNDLIISGQDWFISTSSGVLKAKFQPDTKSIDNIEQISFTESHTLCQAYDSILWIGTSQGVLKYSKGKIDRFSLNENIDRQKVISLHFSEKLRKLFVGTGAGLYWFDPSQQIERDQLFRIIEYRINYQGNSDTAFMDISLANNENSFAIQVDFLNFLSPDEAFLGYSINEQPMQLATDNQVLFNSLQPGDYHFEIWGETSIGQRTDSKSFQISILQPFWKRTEGILLFILATALLLWMVFAIRLRQTRKRARREHETQTALNQLERKALNLSLNPHFLFNSLNSIQSKISQHNDEDLVNYIADFSNLMRNTLENSERNSISIEEEIGILENYLHMEQRRYPDRFDFEINISTQVEELEAEIPPMLLQPFVENSIIHGILPATYKGKIKINIAYEDGYLVFYITDNGLGLGAVKNTRHEPKAIEITKKRVQLLNDSNSLILENLTGHENNITGVRVTIRLKLEQEHLD